MYADDVIRSLRLTVISARSSSEVSTGFASLVIHGFDPRDSLIEDPVVRGHLSGTCR